MTIREHRFVVLLRPGKMDNPYGVFEFIGHEGRGQLVAKGSEDDCIKEAARLNKLDRTPS